MDMATTLKTAIGRLTPRDIAFFVFPGFQIQDLSGPLSAFEIAAKSGIGEAYRCHVISADGGTVTSSSGLTVVTQSIRSMPYHTVFITGGEISIDPFDLPCIPEQLLEMLGRETSRIASVCTGAFMLAQTGLLDGRTATTHWKYAMRLQRHFPKIKVEGDRIFVKDDRMWTSAGITAGIDLALAMIQDDWGNDLAQYVSRMMVVYHRRPGNQSQFSAIADMEPESDRIRHVLSYIREHLNESLTTELLASIACLSPRQFGRSFLAETGQTPAKAVERLRVEAAKARVEKSAEPIEAIARHVGFIDPERMRRAFIRIYGYPPQNIRRMALKTSPNSVSALG